MARIVNLGLLSLVIIFLVGTAEASPKKLTDPATTVLRDNWFIQPSADVQAHGEKISTVGFSTRDWYPATLPSTVMSALVEDKVYPDPYTGVNLRSIPGTTYPIFEDFSNLPMPPASPFRQSWWYRTEFKLPPGYSGKTVWLGFDGINYRANVWMNGVQIASSENLAGTWRLFNLDVTSAAKPGQANSLAVEIFPPQPRDLAITLVDWAPMPPDKEMGIWRDVHITATGPIALRYPAVLTKLNLPSADRAALTLRVELTNAADSPVEAVVKGHIENLAFEQPVRLGPKETQVVHFAPERFPQLTIANPRLWWPVQVGKQNLYPLDLSVEVQGQISDSAHLRFGVRQVTSNIDEKGHRIFQINGKNILIRGAGYSFDLLLRSSPEKQQAELNYVRDLNLNTVRLEGKLENEHFFDLADQMGILVMPGWCCCDQWENWPGWDKENETIAEYSLRDQIRRLERHPSVISWMYGSDFAPPPRIEKLYLGILKELDWPNPSISSAAGRTTTVGPSGMKMTGPYEYVAPSFWYLDTRHGGAFGFNTETSPGPAIPPLASLQRMLPPDHLWPIDSVWEYHAGGMSHTLNVFTEALNERYGPAKSVEEYARKAQLQAYEAHRAMMEAYGRNKYTSTGIIQWMLNNAWPSMIWHMYDWYLRPAGSYFGVKKACEPLHVQYSYDDRSIVVVNSYYQPFANLRVTAKVYNVDMAEKFSKDAELKVGPDSSTRVFTLPMIDGLSTTYFVSLTLTSEGQVQSRNFYWLSTREETIDWSRQEEDSTGEYDISTWSPTKTFADYNALNTLPQVDLDVTAQNKIEGQEGSTTVAVHNPTSTLALAVHLKVNASSNGRVSRDGEADKEILPVLWQDNYFALLPGETRQVTATYRVADKNKATPTVEIDGWNVNRKTADAHMMFETTQTLTKEKQGLNSMNSRPPFEAHRKDLDKVLRVLQDTPAIDREYMAPLEEFQARVRRTNQSLQQHGHTVGFVFSDEQYAGDVPYLGGNTNISIEQVAGIIGPNGFHVVAGLEGGYVAEQLADRAGATVHKVELLQLADEKYPIRAERLEDVIKAAAGKDVDHIALLTPRQVIPAGLVEYLQNIYGREGVVDAQELYFRVKYEKSEIEMRLIADACIVADAMLRAMLAVLRPGRLETEVAAWGAWVGRMLGSERDGFQIMVGANTANRTLIGPALNRHIREGDWVHLGVAPKRDGLTACIRRSAIAVDSPTKVKPEQKYWFDLVEEGYNVGEHWYREVAGKQLPARLQERSLVDFFAGHSQEISRRIGREINLAQQKPYTGTHNSGYTECQEFFGAITLDSQEPLGNQIVTMLDVALRGIGDRWNDVVIPGFDFCVVENTLGKYGTRVETLTKVPIKVQELVAL